MAALSTQDILARLVGFDTTSRLSNLELIRFIEAYLAEFGVTATVQHNEEGTKANIVATIGPNVPGGVVLSGHTDVVPVDGQDWTSEPFRLTEQDGKLLGRGSADMKGFIACALAAVPAFIEAGLKRPVHFAFTYDEEVGCLGIQSLLPLMKDLIAQPRLVVVGEPTSMQIANAHKGQYVSKTRIWGREAHSSRPQDGVNAVAVAAELITFITGMTARARIDGAKDDMFDPPYTSFNVGPISGGSAFNIIPNYCEFDWEFRPVPGADPQAILAEYHAFMEDVINPHLKATFPECRAENAVWAYLPPLKAEPGADAETLALMLAGRNDTTVVAFGTEAGHIQSIDFPAVVCGPGDIAQAHKPDEFVAISQLDACDRFMKRIAEVLS
ncbi:MAG: acetylornithine deacetylase [Alphaproteobacteria bacterium]|nr:acetylornithine deacetylase [Alphaproteobacteria bacterium]